MAVVLTFLQVKGWAARGIDPHVAERPSKVAKWRAASTAPRCSRAAAHRPPSRRAGRPGLGRSGIGDVDIVDFHVLRGNSRGGNARNHGDRYLATRRRLAAATGGGGLRRAAPTSVAALLPGALLFGFPQLLLPP